MNTTTKFAGFALGLAAVFGIALGVGAAVGPEPSEPAGHDAHAARNPPPPGSPAAAPPGGGGGPPARGRAPVIPRRARLCRPATPRAG
ncbi:hypothetical protein [Nocardia cyriacigeorgica]|uniref:hypothetical protein n=1 Tax=Nocardia cyriacigeorgica TaxID=135487 RepID=UPI002458037E|nr:hypothetical protein [Nocardia cyriacigeorgica]